MSALTTVASFGTLGLASHLGLATPRAGEAGEEGGGDGLDEAPAGGFGGGDVADGSGELGGWDCVENLGFCWGQGVGGEGGFAVGEKLVPVVWVEGGAAEDALDAEGKGCGRGFGHGDISKQMGPAPWVGVQGPVRQS